MFEKEIKFITDYNLTLIKKLGAFFTFDKILNSEMHPAVILYLSTQLDYLIYQDRRKLLRDSAFDYSGREVDKYLNLIAQEIKKKKRISFEDTKNLVIQGVSFNLNFILRPKWSLTKLIFNTGESKSSEDIKIMLNTVYYYDYLKNIVISYIEKKGVVSLSAAEFDMIINKIDKEIFNSNSREIISNVLNTVAGFMSQGRKDNATISAAAVELFLKEKNLNNLIKKLKQRVNYEQKGEYSVKEIENIIFSDDHGFEDAGEGDQLHFKIDESVKEMEGEREEEKMIEETIHEEPVQNKSEENLPSDDPLNVEDLLKEERDMLQIMDEAIKSLEEDNNEDFIPDEFEEMIQFKEEGEDIENKIEEELKTSDEFMIEEDEYLIEEDELQTGTIEEELADENFDFLYEEESKDRENETDKQEGNRVDIEEKIEIEESEPIRPIKKRNKDIFEYFRTKDSERIIMSIFNDDREDFTNSMEKISECYNYDEATEILKGIFLTYRVNPYSKDAVTLTNAVSNYFDQD